MVGDELFFTASDDVYGWEVRLLRGTYPPAVPEVGGVLSAISSVLLTGIGTLMLRRTARGPIARDGGGSSQ